MIIGPTCVHDGLGPLAAVSAEMAVPPAAAVMRTDPKVETEVNTQDKTVRDRMIFFIVLDIALVVAPRGDRDEKGRRPSSRVE